MTGFFQNQLFFGEETLNAVHLFIGGWFDYVMLWITVMGNESFYLVVPPILYWCFEKKRALKIMIIFLISSALNDIVKDFFQNPRPAPDKLVPGIRELNIAYRPRSPGFPSGHTQGAVAFWGPVFWYFRKLPIGILSISMILLIPYSRLYLGVHYLGDVIGGYMIGIALLLLTIPGICLFDRYRERIHEAFLLTAALVVPITILICSGGEYVYSSLGALSGLAAGAILAEKRIQFNPKNTAKAAVVKICIGLAGLVILKTGLKLVFPHHLLFNYARYVILGMWCSLIAPFIFSKITFLKGEIDENAA